MIDVKFVGRADVFPTWDTTPANYNSGIIANRATKMRDEILANSELSATQKAMEIVSRISINPLYNKGAERYQFVKDIRSHQRNASGATRTPSAKIAAMSDEAFIAFMRRM